MHRRSGMLRLRRNRRIYLDKSWAKTIRIPNSIQKNETIFKVMSISKNAFKGSKKVIVAIYLNREYDLTGMDEKD